MTFLREFISYFNTVQTDSIGKEKETGHLKLSKVLNHIRTPLFLNGYALVASALGTAALGMVYWILAAHLYPPQIVGINSAAISAMMLLAGISQLNLNNVLIRFIRLAGQHTKRFTFMIFATGISIATVAGVVFLFGVNHWTLELGFLRTNVVLAGWFLLSVVSWSIFSLQDGNLTGLRLATWVPVKNATYSILKIVLMVLFAFSVPALGIFLGWTIAGVLLIIPTHIFIFKFLLKEDKRSQSENSQERISSKVIKFMVADNIGGLSWIACIYLLPVIVATRVGAAANAYYYLSWTIANAIFLITPNVGYSFVVEASAHPENLRSYLNKVAKQASRLVIPIAFVVFVGAPLILRIFGDQYSTQGTLLLRLLALSTIPNMVVSLFVNTARVQQRRKTLLLTQLSSSFSILSLSFIFMSKAGITGVGYAFLTSQTSIALFILLFRIRSLMPAQDNWKTNLPTAQLMKDDVAALLFAQFRNGYRYVMVTVHQLKSRIRARNQVKRVAAILPDILDSIPDHYSKPVPGTWKNIYPLPTVNDQQVFFIGPHGYLPYAVLKIPVSIQAYHSIHREIEVIEALHRDQRLDGWKMKIPTVLKKGQIGDQFYLVEGILPGVTAHNLLINNDVSETFLEPAITAITQLHQLTSVITTIGAQQIQHWVYEPIAVLRKMQIGAQNQDRLNKMAEKLASCLIGKKTSLSWIHGDFAPGNILMTWDGGQITGIVDWELSEKNHLPLMDIFMLLLTSRMIVQKSEIGELVRSILSGEPWSFEEQGFIDYATQFSSGDAIDQEITLLLCWLHHVSTNIIKSKRYQSQNRWTRDNIISVLKLF